MEIYLTFRAHTYILRETPGIWQEDETMDGQTMTYVYFFLAVFAFLIVQGVLAERKRIKKLEQKVREQWGKAPEREYSLEEYDKISHYFERKKDNRFHIDDITWNDMGMDEIFMLLNTAGSAVGEEYLYWALRTPEFDRKILEERSELADYFRSHPEVREQYGVCFAKMGRKHRIALSDYIGKLSELPAFPLWPHVLALVLLGASVAAFAASPYYGIGALVGAIVINMVTYFKYKGDMGVYFTCMSQVADLVEYGNRIGRIRAEESLLESYGALLNRDCSAFRQVRRQAWILVDKSSMGGNLIKAVLDYFCMITHLDLILFRQMATTVRDKGDTLERLIETLGKLELSLCIGSFRDWAPFFCKPMLHETPGHALDGKNMYHPLVEHAVANSISTDRPVLITGSNASGKSTFLKTVGINAILAQTIYTAAAERFETDFCRVYSSMALTDSLETGESYYMVEIKALKRILDAIGGESSVLCFVDEVLRGTNTVERISASSKILESMAGKQVLCFAATHDIELTRLLEELYDNYHFEEQVEDNDITFSYHLETGRARSRNAIRLLGIMGYEKEIIEAAGQMAERFVETGKWSLEEKE